MGRSPTIRVRDLIESRPETQADQARALGISTTALSRIRHGHLRPSRQLAFRMAAYYSQSYVPLTFRDVLAICEPIHSPRRRPPQVGCAGSEGVSR